MQHPEAPPAAGLFGAALLRGEFIIKSCTLLTKGAALTWQCRCATRG
jgi:hypothetical protein